MLIERCGVDLWSGAESMAFSMWSDRIAVTVSDLGAHLASVIMRTADNEVELTVGYPPGAQDAKGCHGASIGRYANRIAGSRFELDGTVYDLDANEGSNQLHGGPGGFHLAVWRADAEVVDGFGRVQLDLTSPAGDQGFPGEVQAVARFELADDRLTIEYTASVDAPTPVNLTNHAYWNLGGGGELSGHELSVAAPRYVEVDPANIPVPGEPKTVSGTRFNCNDRRDLSSIVADGGYDHCFVLDADTVPQAVLRHESGRSLELSTDQVGLQVYTGQHLDPDRRGVALETQLLPDTPNRPDFGDATVRPGAEYRATTTLRFRP